jgi:hypothetical protein
MPAEGTRVPRKRRPSDVMIRALKILRDHDNLWPSMFASLLWDISDWQVHAVGKTGAAYLWRLEVMGLIDSAWKPTEKGAELLSKYG